MEAYNSIREMYSTQEGTLGNSPGCVDSTGHFPKKLKKNDKNPLLKCLTAIESLSIFY